MDDVLKLLQTQAAQNRANFAQAQADRAEVAATKPKQWTAQGRDADSGRMALAADGDEPKLIGDRITSGDIKRGQSVRVNGAGGVVTVDQKPSKQRQLEAAIAPASVQPYWVAFGAGFAVSFDSEAAQFTEAETYPTYSEYAQSAQGSSMFPYGLIDCLAVSTTVWVVGGSIGVGSISGQVRLPLAMSSDQGKTWQVADQFSAYNSSGAANANNVLSLVYGSGSFFALVGTNVWRSDDGLQWELVTTPQISADGLGIFVVSALATWDDTVYLLQTRTGNSDDSGFSGVFLKEIFIHRYDASGFVFVQLLTLDPNAQYGAYDTPQNTVHDYYRNYLSLPTSILPFLFSNNDPTVLPDYGSAIYQPDPDTYLNLLHLGTNQGTPIAYADNIDGQVFLMLSQRWGLNGQEPPKRFGFAVIHEGATWRTCEHPFNGKIDANYLVDSDVKNVTYSPTLQQWLVYEARSYLAISGSNADDWSEPIMPELVTTLDRPVIDPRFGLLASIADQVRAFQVAGNYVS